MRLINLLAVLALLSTPTCVWATTAQDEVDLANNLARQGCYDSAVMFYNKALQYAPGYGPAIAGRAAAMKALKTGKGAQVSEKTKPKKPKLEKTEAPQVAHAATPQPKPKPKVKPLPPIKQALKPQVQTVGKTTTKEASPAVAPLKAETAGIAQPKTQVQAVAEPKVKPVVQPVVTPAVQSAVQPAVKPAVETAAKPQPVPQVHSGTVPQLKSPMQTAASTQNALESKPAALAVPTLKPTREFGISAPNSATSSDEDTSIGIHPAREGGIAAPHLAENPIGIAAPPVSAQPSSTPDQSAPGDDAVPGWLIATAGGTFVLLIVLAICWLTPSLSNSRHLRKRLRGLERTRDER